MKTRITELDYVRAVSMLAIICLHVTSAFIFAGSKFTLAGMNLAFILNQLMRFAVPAFIVLSGISLGYGKADETPLRFYKNRLIKTVLPYLVWYTVYFVYNAYYFQGANTFHAYLKGLLTGAAAPHLYFMVVIIQLYIIFPLLLCLLKKYKYQTLAVTFVVSLYFQLGIYLTYFGIRIIPRPIAPNTWLLFPTWIFYFTAGLLITKDKLKALCVKAGRYLPALLPAALIFGLLSAYEGKALNTFELSIKPQLFIYTFLVLITLLGIGFRSGKIAAFNKAAEFLSKKSMSVYFVHILVLSTFRRHDIFEKGLLQMLLLLVSVTVLSIITSAIIDAFLLALKTAGRNVRMAVKR